MVVIVELCDVQTMGCVDYGAVAAFEVWLRCG